MRSAHFVTNMERSLLCSSVCALQMERCVMVRKVRVWSIYNSAGFKKIIS